MKDAVISRTQYASFAKQLDFYLKIGRSVVTCK